jgi:hypothetical protein
MRFGAGDYAELLAMYLGDGCLSHGGRTMRLRIALDAKYPQIIADTKALLSRCFPENAAGEVMAQGGTMRVVSLYSSHLPCLFPQHGDGPKHERRIVLEQWQRELVHAAPWPFIRGCIRTDGCSFINRTGPYRYPSYAFVNMSREIVELFREACEHVDVFTRASRDGRGRWLVRINRRASVARMLEHVGFKA